MKEEVEDQGQKATSEAPVAVAPTIALSTNTIGNRVTPSFQLRLRSKRFVVFQMQIAGCSRIQCFAETETFGHQELKHQKPNACLKSFVKSP